MASKNISERKSWRKTSKALKNQHEEIRRSAQHRMSRGVAACGWRKSAWRLASWQRRWHGSENRWRWRPAISGVAAYGWRKGAALKIAWRKYQWRPKWRSSRHQSMANARQHRRGAIVTPLWWRKTLWQRRARAARAAWRQQYQNQHRAISKLKSVE